MWPNFKLDLKTPLSDLNDFYGGCENDFLQKDGANESICLWLELNCISNNHLKLSVPFYKLEMCEM